MIFTKKNIYNLITWVIVFLVVDVLSYVALISQFINLWFFSILISLSLVFRRPIFVFTLLIAELFVGSMGHLFVWSLGNFNISVRHILWVLTLLIFFVQFIPQYDRFIYFRWLKKDKIRSQYYQILENFVFKKYFFLLGIFILSGLLIAFLRGNEVSSIFRDFNAWLYFLLIFPAMQLYHRDQEKNLKFLGIIFSAAAVYLSLKTIFLLYVFTHNLSVAPEIYFWLRKTLSGEVTSTLSGWPRVFIQAQIFSGVALLLVFWQNLKYSKSKYLGNISFLLLGSLFFSSILISFSRSFWFAIVGAFIFSLFLVWRIYSWRQTLKALIWFVMSAFLGFIFIYLVAIFPYPNPGKFNADFVGRVSNSGEAALASRWSLLPVLVKEIIKEPFFGQGYGASITYKSSDPRVLENNPNGEYTTYAFEWGFFDIWLKIGLLGLLAYLLLIFVLIKKSLITGLKNHDVFLIGLSTSLIFLAITNFFTPYLNHPLGIGIIIIGACLIQQDKVY